MQKTRWRIKNIPDEKSVLALADSLNISNSLAALLIQRGVTNFFEAKSYFRPSLDLLHDLKHKWLETQQNEVPFEGRPSHLRLAVGDAKEGDLRWFDLW